MNSSIITVIKKRSIFLHIYNEIVHLNVRSALYSTAGSSSFFFIIMNAFL